MFQSVNNPKNKTLNIKLQNVIPHQSPAVQNLVHFASSRCCNMYGRSMINRMNMLQLIQMAFPGTVGTPLPTIKN